MILSPTTMIVEKKMSNHYHFTMLLHWPRPRALTPDPGTMDFTILRKGFMDIITKHFVFLFSNIYWSKEEDFFIIATLVQL